jgi:uncharacterized membrane protein YoaK (UPF0700 family)
MRELLASFAEGAACALALEAATSNKVTAVSPIFAILIVISWRFGFSLRVRWKY